MEESGIHFVLRSAYIEHWNKKWYSFSVSFMQKAQFRPRGITLCRCKLLFSRSSPNVASDTSTLKYYIWCLKQTSLFKRSLEGLINFIPIFVPNSSRLFLYEPTPYCSHTKLNPVSNRISLDLEAQQSFPFLSEHSTISSNENQNLRLLRQLFMKRGNLPKSHKPSYWVF